LNLLDFSIPVSICDDTLQVFEISSFLKRWIIYLYADWFFLPSVITSVFYLVS
jgi:hypothetical protein